MSKYCQFNTNPYGVHQNIISVVGQNKKVLDVGCSEGILTKKMKQNNCDVTGIELDEEASKIAEEFCNELIIGDVEFIQLDTKYEKYFDIILFADILEHLKEPSEVLTRFKKYLNDEGIIIISVPNIANWRKRIQLLFGKFDYQEYGILDNTHIKFFTEKSIKEIIDDAGYKIVKFDLTVGDLNRFSRFFHSVGMIWPNLFAFQFLIVAKIKC
ncbi:Methyltransferase type 11 [Methanobacterium lacus]|uniref:Methyltransferase type 11 n=1 Tax=Methanobacterium lacus (strain AL-21) TaxID=877455 RepID=F0TAU7_METLA|nr:class I SAM-dependent methyltransferase [Methanobacterium lacus]ADZ08973.1 Methyltransferase type 11 [Methanobacterium lacus]